MFCRFDLVTTQSADVILGNFHQMLPSYIYILYIYITLYINIIIIYIEHSKVYMCIYITCIYIFLYSISVSRQKMKINYLLIAYEASTLVSKKICSDNMVHENVIPTFSWL